MKIFILKSNVFSIFKNTNTFRLNISNTNVLFISSKKYFSKKNYEVDDEMKTITLKHLNQENSNLPDIKKVDDKSELLFEEPKPFERNENKTSFENLIKYKQHIADEHKKHKEKAYHKSKIGVSLLILFIGLFSLWVPLYRVICESQGFSAKTTHTDYKFDGKECK
jgi:hypothetical protein